MIKQILVVEELDKRGSSAQDIDKLLNVLNNAIYDK
jgi:hypothetical protein